MDKYIQLLKNLAKSHEKEKLYNTVLFISNEAFQKVSEKQDKEMIVQFNNSIMIIEEAMKIDDVVVVLDIMEYEITNYINL